MHQRSVDEGRWLECGAWRRDGRVHKWSMEEEGRQAHPCLCTAVLPAATRPQPTLVVSTAMQLAEHGNAVLAHAVLQFELRPAQV